MNRFTFYQNVLKQLEVLQTSLNTLRETVKEEIISTSSIAKETEPK